MDCSSFRTTLPGKRYSEEPASLTSQKRSSCRVPGSKKLASSAQIAGMLAASNHTVRCPLWLMCPCQHIGGGRTRTAPFFPQRRPFALGAPPSAPVERGGPARRLGGGAAQAPE